MRKIIRSAKKLLTPQEHGKKIIENVAVEQRDDLQTVFVEYLYGFRGKLPEGAGQITGCAFWRIMS